MIKPTVLSFLLINLFTSIDGYAQGLELKNERLPQDKNMAQMRLVIAENKILLEINSPLSNSLRQDFSLQNEFSKRSVELLISEIQSGDLISFNSAASCELEHVLFIDHSFENTLNADFKGHDSISFEYEIDCESPHKLTSIDCQPLFNSWKKLENIRAHWVFLKPPV